MVSDITVNDDDAYNIGLATACSIGGRIFRDITLSRKDRVSTISDATDTVKVRGQDTVVNSARLLMRTTLLTVLSKIPLNKNNICAMN